MVLRCLWPLGWLLWTQWSVAHCAARFWSLSPQQHCVGPDVLPGHVPAVLMCSVQISHNCLPILLAGWRGGFEAGHLGSLRDTALCVAVTPTAFRASPSLGVHWKRDILGPDGRLWRRWSFVPCVVSSPTSVARISSVPGAGHSASAAGRVPTRASFPAGMRARAAGLCAAVRPRQPLRPLTPRGGPRLKRVRPARPSRPATGRGRVRVPGRELVRAATRVGHLGFSLFSFSPLSSFPLSFLFGKLLVCIICFFSIF